MHAVVQQVSSFLILRDSNFIPIEQLTVRPGHPLLPSVSVPLITLDTSHTGKWSHAVFVSLALAYLT